MEWSITTDCKSVALRASKVQILPDAHENLNAAVTTVAFRFLLCIVEVDLNRGPQPAKSGGRFRAQQCERQILPDAQNNKYP